MSLQATIVRMEARFSGAGSCCCGLVEFTVPIKAVLLPVLCPALLQGLDFRLRGNAEAAKREYNGPN